MSATKDQYHEDVTNPNGNRDPCEVKWPKNGRATSTGAGKRSGSSRLRGGPDGARHPGSQRCLPCADRPRALSSLLLLVTHADNRCTRALSVLLPSYFSPQRSPAQTQGIHF